MEYFNGKKNGNVKEYQDNGNLKFVGEYVKGKLNWKAKEYDYNGKLLFEGEYINNKRNGKGKEYENELLKFEGEYLKGEQWNGKRYIKNNNIIYELKDGKRKIKEYDYLGQLIFEGEYLNGQKNRKGKEYENGSLIYEGEYLEGKKKVMQNLIALK